MGRAGASEPGASDDAARLANHGGEGQRRPGALLGERLGDVTLHAGAIGHAGDGEPPEIRVEPGLAQSIEMVRAERLEADGRALERTRGEVDRQWQASVEAGSARGCANHQWCHAGPPPESLV